MLCKMTVTFDSKSGYSGNGSGSVQWSHTIGAGSNMILIVAYDAYDNTCATPTAISWTASGHGAQALTWIRTDAPNGGNVGGNLAQLWYLLAPNAGSGTIAVTNGNAYACAVSYSYSGVNQTTPFDGATGACAYTNSVSITLNNTNEMVFNFCGFSTFNNACNQWNSDSSGQTDDQSNWGYISGV
jgi:hypothetical protein